MSFVHAIESSQSAAVADRWSAALRSWVLGAEPVRSPVIIGAAYDGYSTVTAKFAVDGGSLAPGAVAGFVLRTPAGTLALG